jgi:hypothetical protein
MPSLMAEWTPLTNRHISLITPATRRYVKLFSVDSSDPAIRGSDGVGGRVLSCRLNGPGFDSR